MTTGPSGHAGPGPVPIAPAVHKPSKANSGTTYTCPMHSEIRRKVPGNCPICGMILVQEETQKIDMAVMPGMTDDAMPDTSRDMMGDAHRKMIWPHYVAIMLGLWLITAPFTLGYLSDFVPNANQLRVMAERGLTSFAHRNMEMTISDVVSGVLVVIFGFLSANAARRHPWAQWANAVVGGWLLVAPLVFWTPLSVAYANGTLVGGAVIALAVLIPMMPGMSMEGMMGKPDIPPEWGYNPASWLQRVPVAALALIGFLIARYMTAYQLGHIDSQWDPFFAGNNGLNGTETIITSSVSKAWPIADAGLGALVYTLELVMTFMGGKDRWRTMPWMVLALAFLIVPLGVVSIYFVIIQPILIGTWCTLCLVTALAMALMIPFSLDEFVAMGQFLVKSHRAGKPFWRTFWTGGAMESGSDDHARGLMAPKAQMFGQAARGVTFPIALLAIVAIGIWLTFTRLSFGSTGQMANSDHIIGLLIVTFAIIAFAEVARSVRLINIPAGLWLIVAPWLLDGATSPLATWNSVICGLLIVGLSIPRGSIKNSYGGWDVYVV
jgi:uncharacterized membrane protein